ncbi:TRIC cation channel family protein [Lysinibacter sp. HNR]|uniref:trimeric intracellular cation channel family protein n=1 Tax=Lysinibacter sp. HNR TaxID=3031408 RepID=UPI00243536A1|nr:TRIC cation channel family protein [Lysinibacter sp. HNR]WGD36576.1 TRIC cation channel family protein [Lysinibacter sp. HNR]
MLNSSFSVPLWGDMVAVGIGSLQGAMFAAGFKKIDLLGISIIGVATGLGGGLLRDLLLGVTPLAFQSNLYLITATLAALVGMLLQRIFTRLDPVITILDAVTIGLFAAIGTTKSLSLGLPVVPSIFIGCIAAVGGSILRDIFINLPIAVMHVGSFYAVAPIAGSVILVGCLVIGQPVEIAALVCVVVTTVIRLLAVRYGWSLPEQKALSLVLRRPRQGDGDAPIVPKGSSRPLSLRRRRPGEAPHTGSTSTRAHTSTIPVIRPTTTSISIVRAKHEQRQPHDQPKDATPAKRKKPRTPKND